MLVTLRLVAAALLGFTTAQDCSPTATASDYPAPSLAEGWRADLLVNDFRKPRSVKVDKNGHLLVLDRDDKIGGITALTLEGRAPCWAISDRRQIIANNTINHGLELSADNTLLYSSDADGVYVWNYNAEKAEVTGDARRVVTFGRQPGSHVTRTLLIPPGNDNLLLVSLGSNGNIDPDARDISLGSSQIKVFDVSDRTAEYNWITDGSAIGWGLRNSVGITQNPVTGGIFSVENSADNLERDNVNLVEENPAEEMNFHGYLQGADSELEGQYHGYPDCYAAWFADEVPKFEGGVGNQFAANANKSVTDAWCRENSVDPILSFPAHLAPMSIKFNQEATTAFITFRGSWNRENPQGYKLVAVPFDNSTGFPVASSNSMDNYKEIMSNRDLSKCPDECFRPVGLEWADEKALFMTADTTGDIYVVYRPNDYLEVDDRDPVSETTLEDEEDPQESEAEDSEGGWCWFTTWRWKHVVIHSCVLHVGSHVACKTPVSTVD